VPLFQIEGNILRPSRPTNFKLEKELQHLVETNLEAVFNCRLVASEFPTGAEHAGRIDTLALSEDNNPVIIEYKRVESSELVNQSLYYLAWIQDHRGDFQVAVDRKLGKEIEIDWSDIRVICIAPGYKKYDIYAVQMMGASIELWQYHFYENGCLYLEEMFRRSSGYIPSIDAAESAGKDPVMVAAGKKAAITRATASYTFEQHIEGASDSLLVLVSELREFILGIDDSVEESPKKNYVGYKVAQNFVCMQLRGEKVILWLKLDPKEHDLPPNARDVSKIGHHGTGNLELTIKNQQDAKAAKEWIRKAYAYIGG